jgi:hypothetical protein
MRGLIRVWLLLALATMASRAIYAAAPDPSQLANQIDEQIDLRLKSEALPPAEVAGDAEFLRRVYLDLHGVVPTRDQAGRFLADSRPDKRARLVDELLASPRYGQYLADVWQNDLISPLADDRRKRADLLRQWLTDEFNTKTWDRIASDLVTATGKMEDNPAVTYLVEGRLPRNVPDLTDLTARYFLGLRISCAQCHDHPFAKWKQQDFWGMAAFFAQIQTPRRAKQVYEKGVIDDPSLTLANLRDAGVPDGFLLSARTFLGGGQPPADQTPNRIALARWMTSPDNPYFARAAANRTWWRLFGRGIVNPVDDIHEGHPATYPQLLDLLARRFVECGFDLKFLTRSIVLSRAYQRTSRPGDAPQTQATLFGRMSIKVLSAPQLYDSLETVFGPPAKVAGIDAREGVRAEFTQFFGDNADPDPAAYRRGIPHLLRQMNSGQFTGRGLDSLVSRVTTTSASSPETIASELFLTILARQPTPDEQRLVKAYLERSGSSRDGCRELAWVLMMTSEFSLNH